jgi:hypothetical protein
MGELEIEQLSIKSTRVLDKVRLDWRGTGRLQDAHGQLSPFLDQASADAATAGVSIEMHIEEMAFLNSETMGAVIRFIKINLDRRVGVEVVFDAGQSWQRFFSEGLRGFERRSNLFTLRPA